jgi:hypothetical protein
LVLEGARNRTGTTSCKKGAKGNNGQHDRINKNMTSVNTTTNHRVERAKARQHQILERARDKTTQHSSSQKLTFNTVVVTKGERGEKEDVWPSSSPYLLFIVSKTG